MSKSLTSVALAAILGASLGPVIAQQDEDPIFGFIPPGGRTLLSDLIDAGATDDVVARMLEADRDAAAWLEWFDANTDLLPGLAAFDDWELRTLAAYLDNVAPAESATDSALPRDGRDLAMRYCQSCHIITVTVTQERTREAWLGTMNNPSHVEVDMTAAERSLMADYLVINAGIPIDLIPPALRAGGASY